MPFKDHLRARGDPIWQNTPRRLRGGDPLNFNVSSLGRIAATRRAHFPKRNSFLGELPVNEFPWRPLMAVLLANDTKWDSGTV